MHRLNRASVETPECLCDVPSGKTYANLGGVEKQSIRACLLTMQGSCCAYCERRTGDGRDDGHIEHFRKQANHGRLTLNWDNLFWSCNDEKTCGKRKDQCEKGHGNFGKFSEEEIIDPCRDDPDKFLLFISDGTVRARDGLSAPDLRRAEETIRVFGLDSSPYLRKAREDSVSPYLKTLPMLKSLGWDHFRAVLESILSNLHGSPHSTTIRHTLSSFLS